MFFKRILLEDKKEDITKKRLKGASVVSGTYRSKQVFVQIIQLRIHRFRSSFTQINVPRKMLSTKLSPAAVLSQHSCLEQRQQQILQISMDSLTSQQCTMTQAINHNILLSSLQENLHLAASGGENLNNTSISLFTTITATFL